MKKILLTACSILLIVLASTAQKYVIIDTKYILDKLPEYRSAQAKLDDIAAGWQKEIDSLQSELNKMYKDYDAEQVMLSDDLRKKREAQLFTKEKYLRDQQRTRFRFEGDLFKTAGIDKTRSGQGLQRGSKNCYNKGVRFNP